MKGLVTNYGESGGYPIVWIKRPYALQSVILEANIGALDKRMVGGGGGGPDQKDNVLLSNLR